MPVSFTLTSKTRVDCFKDQMSLGDVTDYEIDCTAWQDDNDTISGAAWSSVDGNVAISNQAVNSGVVSATISAAQAGTARVEVLLQTAGGLAKKIWLQLRIKSQEALGDDYGFCD